MQTKRGRVKTGEEVKKEGIRRRARAREPPRGARGERAMKLAKEKERGEETKNCI